MAEDITPSPPGNVPASGSESSLAEPVDLSKEIPPAVPPHTIATGIPFNPEPQRELIRGRIAQGLLVMLALGDFRERFYCVRVCLRPCCFSAVKT